MNKFSTIRIFTYYLDPLSKLGFNESIETRASKFSHSSTIATTVPTLNSQIKASSFFWMEVQGYYFELLFCILLMQGSNHSRWCHYIFISSGCASTRWRTWRNIDLCECFPMVMWKQTNRKGGVHLNGLVNVGLSHVT